MTVYEYGVDIDSSFEFLDGDLKLASYEENLVQAIGNRLRTIYGSLSMFYEDYGSYLYTFLGWRRRDETLNFIKIEVENTLKKDPRLTNFNVEVDYATADNTVDINIQVFYENEVLDLNYVFNENGVSVVE